MFEQKKKRVFWLKFSALTILLVAIVVWAGCKERSSEQSKAESIHSEPTSSEPVTQPKSESAKIDTKPKPKMSLSDVIKAAKTWGPAFTPWYGKETPDFTLTDITGEKHKLNDYKGRDILLVFWLPGAAPAELKYHI